MPLQVQNPEINLVALWAEEFSDYCHKVKRKSHQWINCITDQIRDNWSDRLKWRKIRESRYIIYSLKEPPNKVSRLLPALSNSLRSHLCSFLFRSHQLISISVSSSILALVSSQLNRTSNNYCTLGLNYPISGAGSTGQVVPARSHGADWLTYVLTDRSFGSWRTPPFLPPPPRLKNFQWLKNLLWLKNYPGVYVLKYLVEEW